MARARASALFVFLALAGQQGARADEPPPASPPSPLAPLEAVLRAEGCRPSEVLTVAERWYAACGTQGVLVVQQTGSDRFALVERRTTQGSAHAVFVRNGVVWVETQRTEATLLSELPVVATAGAPAPSRTGALPVAEPIAVQNERRVAPPRPAGVFALEAALRPVLPIDELAIAALAELAATYYGERAFYAAGRFFPLGGLIGRGADVGALGMQATAGYDHTLFAVGLGAGALQQNTLEYEYSPELGSREVERRAFRLAIVQEARLGAVDGLGLRVTNAFVLGDDRWRFGFVDLRLQFPAGQRTWLTVGGGGGAQADFFYAELGLRRLLRGMRGRGSLFVRPTVGVAGIARPADSWIPGPMVGAHLEWRP